LKKIIFIILAIAVCTGILALTIYRPTKTPAKKMPNILWVVWDTVRADRFSLYGYDKPTTPFLEEWSKKGRIFTNCLSVANTTVPAHASMFTGLLPNEHRLYNTENNVMGNDFVTIAELLQKDNYQTYLFSANPRISQKRNFTQGFDKAEHPWDSKFRDKALSTARNKILPNDTKSGFAKEILSDKQPPRMFLASGEIAQQGVEDWLATCNKDQSFFIFLNYMDAHQPYIPMKSYRKKFMTPEQVKKSYSLNRSLDMIWNHCFGLQQYSEDELEIISLTYDSVIAELDHLFKKLVTSLKKSGHLDNTIVILTADHGEHLGEKHLLDHQYSVYEPLLRVPLIISYPPFLEPGVDENPVMNFDLFRTILEMTDIDMPEKLNSKAVSLLKPQPKNQRTRLSVCPEFLTNPLKKAKKFFPDFDPTRWRRTLQAVYQGSHKYIWASNGHHELYNIKTDPGETNNLIKAKTGLTDHFSKVHKEVLADLKNESDKIEKGGALTEAERKHLEALGYIGSP